MSPVFTKEHDNIFVATGKYGDVKARGGLAFAVKDYDRLGSDDAIGMLTVLPETLIELGTSRKVTELELQSLPNRPEAKGGFLTVKIINNATGSEKYWKPKSDMTPRSSRSLVSGNSSVAPSVNKEIFIEIISCRELFAADKGGTSDPYVKIKLGGKEVHKTTHIEKTLNPVFSSTHKNAYIIKCTAKELYAKKGIELVVKDHDKGLGAFGFTNDDLGSVKITAATLYEAAPDEIMELPLSPTAKSKSSTDKVGFITIQLREATLGDKDQIKRGSSIFNNVKSKIVKSPKQVCIEDDQLRCFCTMFKSKSVPSQKILVIWHTALLHK